MTSRRALTLAVALPTAITIALLLPFVLRAYFLSDDYLLTNLLEPGGGDANWGEIGTQFSQQWLYSHAYWRPIVNLAYGVNIWLLGFTPVALAAFNLLLHTAVVAGVARLCLRLPRQRSPVLAAVLGASVCAFHPAVIETVLWISARVSGLEVFFRVAALCAFQTYLLRPSKPRYVLVAVLAALALGSKESAVVLPAALLGLDLLHQPRRAWRSRVALHAPLAVVWIGYAIVRVTLLGEFVGSPVPEPTFAQWTEVAIRKLEVLMLPGGALTAAAWGTFAIGAVVVARDRLGALLFAALVLAAWLAVSLAPTYKAGMGNGMVGSRMLYGALPVLALLLAHAVGAARTTRARIGIGALAAVPVFATVLAGFDYADEFDSAWRESATAAAALERAGASADAAHPLGILSFPPCTAVPGPINPVTFFVLGQPPFARPPFPAIGLGQTIYPLPFAMDLLGDPRPIRALLDAGSTIARWSPEQDEMVFWSPAPTPSFDRAQLRDHELTWPEPISPWALEQLEITTAADADHGRVVWLTSLGELDGPHALQFAGGVRLDDGTRRFTIDVTPHAPLLVLAHVDATLRGVRIEIDADVRSARAFDRIPRLELTARLDGRAIDYAELLTSIVAPQFTGETPMRLVLAGAAATFAIRVEAGRPVELPDHVLLQIRNFSHALHARDFLYWFETTAPPGSPGSARSALDRFRLRKVPR